MEYEHAFWIAAGVALIVYVAFGQTILRERKINEGHKLTIERLTHDKHRILVEKDWLQDEINRTRPPKGNLLSELPELFTDEEFATRAQKAEEGRAMGRRLNDRYEGPKPTLGWDEQDSNSIGSGI